MIDARFATHGASSTTRRVSPIVCDLAPNSVDLWLFAFETRAAQHGRRSPRILDVSLGQVDAPTLVASNGCRRHPNAFDELFVGFRVDVAGRFERTLMNAEILKKDATGRARPCVTLVSFQPADKRLVACRAFDLLFFGCC
jgi:hypothetical protein